MRLLGQPGPRLGHPNPLVVKFELKNLESLADGWYAVEVPPDWANAPRRDADGILELSTPMEFSLTPSGGGYIVSSVDRLSGDDARDAIAVGASGGRFGVDITRDGSRHFQIMLYTVDPARSRWVRLGSADAGYGTQSAVRKPLSWLVLPAAVAVDVATAPVLFTVLIVYINLPPDWGGPS